MRVRSAVGGGSLPLCEPWSWAVSIDGRAEAMEAALRRKDIVARIADDRLLLDVRTLMDGDLEKIAHAFKEITFD
jgi:L-seryl-tRNA(Ser) seleniumtransferase